MSDELDRRYLARTLELAANGFFTTDPNPRVGCVIVNDGIMVGEGWHERAGGPHAEVVALQQAGNKAQGATVYVSLEPCSHHGRTPPCADALISAKVSRVVVASMDPNPLVSGAGLEKLQSAGIEVRAGLLAEEAEQLNPGFNKRMRQQLPFVRCKIAMSLDGRTAMASGESQWITGVLARQDVHYYRARSSAILTGIGTVLADDPSLNVRLSEVSMPGLALFNDAHQPMRVIVDTQLRTPETAKMLSLPGQTLIYTLVTDLNRHVSLQQAGAEIIIAEAESESVSLTWVLRDLAKRGVNELMIEAGATINGALLAANLIDELVFYVAPTLLGDMAKGAFHLPGITNMAQKLPLKVRETRQIGVDWRIIAVPDYPQ